MKTITLPSNLHKIFYVHFTLFDMKIFKNDLLMLVHSHIEAYEVIRWNTVYVQKSFVENPREIRYAVKNKKFTQTIFDEKNVLVACLNTPTLELSMKTNELFRKGVTMCSRGVKDITWWKNGKIPSSISVSISI